MARITSYGTCALCGKRTSEAAMTRHLKRCAAELNLRVVSEREGRIGREPLRILSCNEAPVWTCTLCDQPATQICTYCMYEQGNPFYCEAHAEDHDCEEEMLLPVLNSPRMGMCGYTGPL